MKIIYEEGGLKEPVANKIIAEKLQLSPASVSEMLTKLQHNGLIDYVAYKGSILTEKGIEVCKGVLRSHRLWEVFLMRHLHYSWREAHEEAHLLEHVSTERMVERLDKFLNFPHDCPHGEPIPRNGVGMEDHCLLVPISNLSVGETAKLSRIVEEGELLDYAERSGLKIGENICILSRDEYEGPIHFSQEGHDITISYKAATKIFVEQRPTF